MQELLDVHLYTHVPAPLPTCLVAYMHGFRSCTMLLLVRSLDRRACQACLVRFFFTEKLLFHSVQPPSLASRPVNFHVLGHRGRPDPTNHRHLHYGLRARLPHLQA